MNVKLRRRAAQMLSEKLMVIPSLSSYRKILNTDKDIYIPQSIHHIGEVARYFPETRELNLFMPASAENKNIKVSKQKPQQIIIKDDDGNDVGEFSLNPVCFYRKVADIKKKEYKYLSAYLDMDVISGEEKVSLPMHFSVKMPLSLDKNGLANTTNYDDMMGYIADTLYKKIYSACHSKFTDGMKEKDKKKFVLTREQQAKVEETFFEFIKNFDAFEIGRNMLETKLSKEKIEGKTQYFQTYDMMIYRLPTRSVRQKQTKFDIMQAVKERKLQNLEESRIK